MIETRTLRLSMGVDVTVQEGGSGQPVLVLHGGGGPATVASLTAHLAGVCRVVAPTHPGWNGTARPESLHSIAKLAEVYLGFLADEDLRDVVLVGSSIGGWLAAEIALGDAEHRVGGLVLIDAVGIEVEGEPIPDFFALDARSLAEYAFHDAARFYVDPATVPPEQAAIQRANVEALRTFAGDPYMHDPTLLARLGTIAVPSLVLWGDSDRICTPAYGHFMADAIPGARFVLIPNAGHLPHIENPGSTFAALDVFLARLRTS